MLTSIFRIVFIRSEKSFVSKQGHPQPHIHSEASVLKGHNCRMVYCRVTVATLFHDNDLFPSIFNIVFFSIFSTLQHNYVNHANSFYNGWLFLTFLVVFYYLEFFLINILLI